MALAITRTLWSFALALIFTSAFCIKLGTQQINTNGNDCVDPLAGKAEEEAVPETSIPVHYPAEVVPETSIPVHYPAEEEPETSIPVHDPAQVVAKALLCFNDKYIYSSCEESYRLSASGNLDVPFAQTEAYCGGPCLIETHLVLDCIDNILANFLFYNRATIQDVRDTIHAGCGYGPERGNFNVLEHIEAEGSDARRVAKEIGVVLGLVVALGHGLLFV